MAYQWVGRCCGATPLLSDLILVGRAVCSGCSLDKLVFFAADLEEEAEPEVHLANSLVEPGHCSSNMYRALPLIVTSAASMT